MSLSSTFIQGWIILYNMQSGQCNEVHLNTHSIGFFILIILFCITYFLGGSPCRCHRYSRRIAAFKHFKQTLFVHIFVMTFFLEYHRILGRYQGSFDQGLLCLIYYSVLNGGFLQLSLELKSTTSTTTQHQMPAFHEKQPS